MPKVMITTVLNSDYSSPAVVVVDCNTIADAKQLAEKINGSWVQIPKVLKTVYRSAEVLDV